jgi:hypothetical protein
VRLINENVGAVGVDIADASTRTRTRIRTEAEVPLGGQGNVICDYDVQKK